MKISIVTPSVRLEMLPIVAKCLSRQKFRTFEWIIIEPQIYKTLNSSWARENFEGLERYEFGSAATGDTYTGWKNDEDDGPTVIFLEDPPKREGDYYRLNGAWNTAFKKAKGELVVSIVDGLWFPPDLLEKLWIHYKANPKACVGAIGHQYDKIENDKPEHQVWRDPRAREDFGSFYEIKPIDLELCIASIPRQAILDVGGVDEEFDEYAALSEKEMCLRIDKLGYKFYLDQTIEYRAIKHDRLTKDWDQRYQQGWFYFDKCLKDIQSGKRLKLNFLDNKV